MNSDKLQNLNIDEMTELNKKMNEGTASPEEKTKFYELYNRILESTNKDLDDIIAKIKPSERR